MKRDIRPENGPVVNATTGVTVVACGVDGCPHVAAAPDGCDDEMRAAIRETPHGILVRAGCLHGCSTETRSAGASVLVQPCDVHRRPTGPTLVVGPLHEPADVTECCAWLRSGAPMPAPAHLVAGVLLRGG